METHLSPAESWAPATAVCETDSRMLSIKCVVAEVRAATAVSHHGAWNPAPAGVAVRLKDAAVFLVILVGSTQLICFHWPEWICASLIRDPSSTRWATEMPGAADWNESAASSGSAGFLPQEVGNRDGVFPKPRKAGREVHGKNKKYKGSSAVQVRETCLPIAPMLYLFLIQNLVKISTPAYQCSSSRCSWR